MEGFDYEYYSMCNLLISFAFFRIHHSVIMLKGQEVLFHQIKTKCQTLQLTLRLCQARMHTSSTTHLRESTNNITWRRKITKEPEWNLNKFQFNNITCKSNRCNSRWTNRCNNKWMVKNRCKSRLICKNTKRCKETQVNWVMNKKLPTIMLLTW